MFVIGLYSGLGETNLGRNSRKKGREKMAGKKGQRDKKNPREKIIKKIIIWRVIFRLFKIMWEFFLRLLDLIFVRILLQSFDSANF